MFYLTPVFESRDSLDVQKYSEALCDSSRRGHRHICLWSWWPQLPRCWRSYRPSFGKNRTGSAWRQSFRPSMKWGDLVPLNHAYACLPRLSLTGMDQINTNPLCSQQTKQTYTMYQTMFLQGYFLSTGNRSRSVILSLFVFGYLYHRNTYMPVEWKH